MDETRRVRDARARLERASDDDRPDLIDELARMAAGDVPGAAAELAWAVRHFRLAHPALRKYLFSEADIDGAEQRTLVAVAYRIGSFRSESRFTTWLYQVASNEAKQLIRAEARHRDRSQEFDEEQLSDQHAEQFVGRVSSMIANQEVIDQAIAQISANHQRALLFREGQGLTYEEIADALDVPLSTAKTWVRRGRNELAQLLSDALGQPG